MSEFYSDHVIAPLKHANLDSKLLDAFYLWLDDDDRVNFKLKLLKVQEHSPSLQEPRSWAIYDERT